MKRSLNDSKVTAISADLRFTAAFNAALAAATTAQGIRLSGSQPTGAPPEYVFLKTGYCGVTTRGATAPMEVSPCSPSI